MLDPFGQTGLPSASFNALAELDPDSDLIVDDGDSRSRYWNDSARTLLQGIILFALSMPEKSRDLMTVRSCCR